MIGWCSWLRGKKSAASSQTFLVIYPFPGNVLSSNGEKKQKAPNPSLPATGESSSGKPALPAGFHASSPISESSPIRRSSYFIQQDTPLPSLQRKIFPLLSVKSYSETEGEHPQHPCFPFGPAGGFPFIFMAKIPGSRDSGLPYPSHAVCFKTARRRDEIAVAVNGFGNSLFPEIPQQFHPTIGKHGTVQYFHIPGMGGIDQSLGNICST